MNKPSKVFYEKPNSTYYEKPKQVYYEKNGHPKNSSYNAPQKNIEEYYAPSYQKVNNDSESLPENKPVSRMKAWIANGILIALSVIFVVLLFVAIEEANNYNRKWTRDEDDFWYSITDERYSDVLSGYYSNQYTDVDMTPELRECYAVAEYFEAASLYKVAVHVGNQEDMNKYASAMQESLEYMQDFLYVAEDINAKLGIE